MDASHLLNLLRKPSTTTTTTTTSAVTPPTPQPVAVSVTPTPPSDLDRLFRVFHNPLLTTPDLPSLSSPAPFSDKVTETGTIRLQQTAESLKDLLLNRSSLASPPVPASSAPPIPDAANLLAQLMGQKDRMLPPPVQLPPTVTASSRPLAIASPPIPSSPSVLPTSAPIQDDPPMKVTSKSNKAKGKSKKAVPAEDVVTGVVKVDEPVRTSPFSFVSPFDLLAAAQEEHEATSRAQTPTTEGKTSKKNGVVKIESPVESDRPSTPLPTAPTTVSSSHCIRFDIAEKESTQVQQLEETVETIPIALFKNALKFSRGQKVASWNKGICYTTRSGGVRVIDRASGARMLLKGHEGAILDIEISPRSADTRTRMILSVGVDGKLIVWRIPDEFTESTATFELVRTVASTGTSTSPVLVKLHPSVLNCFSHATLDGVYETVMDDEWLRSERGLSSVQKVVTDQTVVDFAYSSDGTGFAVLLEDGSIALRHASTSTTIASGLVSPSQIVFISPSTTSPATSLLVSSHHGNQLYLISLASPHLPMLILDLTDSDSTAEASFGNIRYDPATTTILLSNSKRGSLFCLRLNFDSPSPVVSQLVEIKTSNKIVGFYLAESTERGEGTAIVCTHPSGVHEIRLVDALDVLTLTEEKLPLEKGTDVVEASEKSDNIEEETVVEIVNLPVEAAVDVEVEVEKEVEIKVEEIEETQEIEHVKSGVVVVPSSPDTPILEPTSPVIPLPSSPSASTQLNAAIKSMKSSKAIASSSSVTPQPSSPAPTSAVTNAWANAGNGMSNTSMKKLAKESMGMENVLKEMRKLEEGLAIKMRGMIEEQAERFEESRRTDQLEESARQETTLALISQTLTANTSKLVEQTIQAAIRNEVIPAIRNVVAAAIENEIKKGVVDALAIAVPKQLEALLHRPEITAHLSRSFSDHIVPSLQRNLAVTIAASIIPSVTTSIESLMVNARQDLKEVSKGMVKERTQALERAEREVKSMREDIGLMKQNMARMEAALAASAQRPSLPSAVPPQSTTATRSVSKSKPTIIQPQPSLPPIPRPSTPLEQYEELFTAVLQPTQSSDSLTPLMHLIQSSPLTRLDAVFPSPPLRPRISAAVVLSLAFRLAQVIENGEGLIGEEQRSVLRWIRRCLLAIDGKDPDVVTYAPRILDSVIASLVNRGHKLAVVRDAFGMEQVRTVEMYAKSRKVLF